MYKRFRKKKIDKRREKMGSSKKSITRKNRNDKKRSKKGQREKKSRDNQNNTEKDLEKGEKEKTKEDKSKYNNTHKKIITEDLPKYL